MITTYLTCFTSALILFLLGRMLRQKSRVNLWRYLAWLLNFLCVFPLAISIYIAYYVLLSDVQDEQRLLRAGITYTRETLYLDRHKAVIHSIQLPASIIDIQMTPPVKVGSTLKNTAMTTSQALLTYDADIAINASFFSPFKDNHLFDYFPHQGDYVTPIGSTIAGGYVYGREADWPVFIVYKNNRLAIKDGLNDDAIASMKAVVSGRSRLINTGTASAFLKKQAYPRAAIGMNKNRDTLWLFVVDGKQPFYSNGVDLAGLSDYMLSKGVYNALELDGGGSATMVWLNQQQRVEILNRPIHTKIPNRARPVANHLLITIND